MGRKQLSAIITIAIYLGMPLSQAYAQTPSADSNLQHPTEKNPWISAGLSLAAPIALGLATMPAFSIGAPVGFGAGHWYAGAPERGLAISAGGLGVVLLGGMAGYIRPDTGVPSRRLQEAFTMGVFAATIYGAWASYDAFNTTIQLNRKSEDRISGE